MSTQAFDRTRPGALLRILLLIALGMLLYVPIATLFVSDLSLVQNFRRWLLYGLLPWAVLAPLLLPLLRRVVLERAFLLQAASAIGTLALAGLLHMTLIAAIQYLAASDTSAIGWQGAGSLLVQSGMLLFDACVCAVLAGAAGRQALEWQMKQKDEAAYRLSRSLSDTKMQSLMMQLNPHFLFNTLNGLAVLIDKRENDAAREMLGELSGFLRQVLRNKGEKWVTLEEELEFIRQYLRIEQYRFGTRLVWFEDCEPLALSARIPPLLLQPLFENAIVHGLADKQGECRLGFECRVYDRHLILMVFDNGENFDALQDPLDKGGIGLSNVQARLREVYGDNFSLKLEKKADGTLVTLKLPAYKDSQF